MYLPLFLNCWIAKSVAEQMFVSMAFINNLSYLIIQSYSFRIPFAFILSYLSQSILFPLILSRLSYPMSSPPIIFCPLLSYLVPYYPISSPPILLPPLLSYFHPSYPTSSPRNHILSRPLISHLVPPSCPLFNSYFLHIFLRILFIGWCYNSNLHYFKKF